MASPPLINFDPIAELPDVFRKARARANRERLLSDLGQGASPADVARMLFRSGDMEGGLALTRLADAQAQREYNIKRDERDFTYRQDEARRTADWRRQEAERAQKNADRQFEASGTAIKEIEDLATGVKRLVRVDRAGNITSLPVPGAPATAQPLNPYAAPGGMTEGQGTSGLYTDRMAQAHEIITDNEKINEGVLGAMGGIAANAPLVGDSALFNAMASPERQKFMQAQRNFINAVLRKESGAVISPSEFANAAKQYFPQPGDGPDVIEQKRRNRIAAIQGLARSAGPRYRAPPIAGVDSFRNDEPSPLDNAQYPAGPAPQGTAAPAALPPGVTAESAIAEARAAIAAGADPAAVAQRLKQLGIDPAGQ